MPAWLSEEWVAATGAAASEVPVPSAITVGVAVSGLPAGEVRYQRSLGTGGGAPADVADVSFTMTADDGRAMVRAELDPSVAFMQGRLKTAGDPGLVLSLLAGWSSPDGRAACGRIAALTDF